MSEYTQRSYDFVSENKFSDSQALQMMNDAKIMKWHLS